MSAPTAEIIAVGSELLTPHRIDTNSLFLTSRLNDAGVRVIGKCVVGDDVRALEDRLRAALARVDILILTGGLGPTADDITRDAVASVLGRTLFENAEALAGEWERSSDALGDEAEGYPFPNSFDEVAHGIRLWSETARERLGKAS